MVLSTTCSRRIPDDSKQNFSSDTVYTTSTDEVDSVTTIQSTITPTTTTEIITKNEPPSVSLTEFEYQPPESVKDIIWYSDYKEFEILYTFYPNDDTITNNIPKEIVDKLSEYVTDNAYISTDLILFYGVTTFDMNSDGVNDYLVTARTGNEYFLDFTDPYSFQAWSYSAVFLKSATGYDFIPRATTKFNTSRSYKNDGFVMSTKTNGLRDIFIEIFEGTVITYNGESIYQPENLSVGNLFLNTEIINNSLCKIEIQLLNGPQVNDNYIITMKLKSPNPFMYNILYGCDETGQKIIYNTEFKDSTINPFTDNGFYKYTFYIPIINTELYNETYEQELTPIEIRYVSVDEIE
jgi:hypothetical protein